MLKERPSGFNLSNFSKAVAADSESPKPAPAPGTPTPSNSVFEVLVPKVC